MEYLPFGESLVEEHLNSNNSPFRFNAKELDATERIKNVRWTFLAKGRACRGERNYYYGARYGVYPEHSRRNPKFSIWMNVDPLAEQMPEWSSYAYTFNNPVNFIDPDGRAPEWIPDSNGNLIAEKGDSAGSLAKELDVSQSEAEKILADQGYGTVERDGKRYTNISEGDKVDIDNNATRAIANSNGITTEQALEQGSNAGIDPSNDGYMCDQCAQMAVNGDEINPQNASQYSQFLSWNAKKLGFTQVDSFDGVPINGGIATIGSDHTVSSYGQSRDGTVYVLSKDGHLYKPQVYTLEKVIELFNQVQGTNFTTQDVRYYKKNK